MKKITNKKSNTSKTALSFEEAHNFLLSRIENIGDVETISLSEAKGRICAEDIRAPFDTPRTSNSAMDGFAIKFSDLEKQKKKSFNIIGSAFAGHPFCEKVKSGEAIKIMTGAPLPEGTDTVVIKEETIVEHNLATFVEKIHENQNIRRAGEDLKFQETCVSKSQKIEVGDIGVLAALGITKINVYRQIKVAYFSTGDELKKITEPLGFGDIYDSNLYTISEMLDKPSIKPTSFGIVEDNQDKIKKALLKAASENDVIITTGGVSVGEADHLKNVVKKLGHLELWKVEMKPGRPLAFGKIKNSYFFGLPGNPVSAMVTFEQFVTHALEKLSGQKKSQALTIYAEIQTDIVKTNRRTEFQRGILTQPRKGQFLVKKLDQQSSGALSSMSRANCFIHLSPDLKTIRKGELVLVQPFSNMINTPEN